MDKGKDMNKQFAVLGLGSFGRSVALSLEKMGCDVMVVDDSYEKIQEISDKVSYAMKADVTDKDALQALGARNLDGAVVAVSEHPEANIMATLLCKEMGIPLVVAKAKDKLQGMSSPPCSTSFSISSSCCRSAWALKVLRMRPSSRRASPPCLR